jgi:hypothetical protein
MILNHLNLIVSDVPQAHAFLQKYFALHDQGGNKNNVGNFLAKMPPACPEEFHARHLQ